MTPTQQSIDVVTLGRASVDLYGEQVGGRLEDVNSFMKYVGGCPTNIAVGGARLGLRTGLITRVGDDHMGRYIVEQLARDGVNTDGIVADKERLTALVLLGIHGDRFPLIFYRQNCADMALSVDDIDEDLVASSKSILVTGTHFSTETVRGASQHAVYLAKSSGRKVVLDVDYRPVLWGLTPPDLGEERFIESPAVTEILQTIVPDCDLIVGTEDELRILGGATDTLHALRKIRSLSSAIIVCKRGDLGCVVFDKEIPACIEGGIVGSSYKVKVLNVLGAGDGFLAGFLRGWLRDLPLQECCNIANACGAIVVSRHGCAPATPTWTELQRFLSAHTAGDDSYVDARLGQVHWSTVRGGQIRDLCVLAVDHRGHFEELAAASGRESDAISQFKMLAFKAAQSINTDEFAVGLLVDGRFGQHVLHAAAETSCWVGRPIEMGGAFPLEFDASRGLSAELRSWPSRQVVKCLCHYHPNQAPKLRRRQDRDLQRLFLACRSTGHELLLEIIASSQGQVDESTVPSIIRHLYSLGIYPDWWKLEAAAGIAGWLQIENAVTTNDPNCRGILVLGLGAPQDELVACLELASAIPSVRGFAVGRTIFQGVAERWFANDIDDRAAVEQLAGRFGRLVSAWQQN